ncbi:MAG: ABC transporter permease [Lachnospiraceae bacterium]
MILGALLWRNIKWRFMNKITIIVTIIQPLIWLLLYGSISAGQRENYIGFMLPGIMVLVMFSACCSSGMMNYIMKSQGSFYRLLISPVRRSSIILGQNLEAILLSLLEIGILIIISFMMAAYLYISLPVLLISLLILILTAFFMANIAYAVSLKLPNEMIYETITNMIVLPLFFASTALLPVDEIDGIMRYAVMLNPLSHVINVLRELLIYRLMNVVYIGGVIFILLVLDVFSFLISLKVLRRETEG